MLFGQAGGRSFHHDVRLLQLRGARLDEGAERRCQDGLDPGRVLHEGRGFRSGGEHLHVMCVRCHPSMGAADLRRVMRMTSQLVRAMCVIKGADGVSGVVEFEQKPQGGPTKMTGKVTGLKPGKHGFHIHQYGDLSEGCKSAGGHFNPFNRSHGGPAMSERHVGDLGNIEADEKGNAKIEVQDQSVSLIGANSIIGRAVVVHAGEDDLGLGGKDDSKTTGAAGGRVGCGVIGIKP